MTNSGEAAGARRGPGAVRALGCCCVVGCVAQQPPTPPGSPGEVPWWVTPVPVPHAPRNSAPATSSPWPVGWPRPTMPVPAPTRVPAGEWSTDSITGFGWRWYTVSVPRHAFVDTVVAVDRKAHNGARHNCQGLAVYLTVQSWRPDPQPFELAPGDSGAPTSGNFFAELGALVAGALQQSAFCSPQSAAKVSIKDSGTNDTWWLLVQTREGARIFNASHINSSAAPLAAAAAALAHAQLQSTACSYRLVIETRPRTQFMLILLALLLNSGVVVALCARSALRAMARPQWRWWKWRAVLTEVWAEHIPRAMLRGTAALALLGVLAARRWCARRVARPRQHDAARLLSSGDTPGPASSVEAADDHADLREMEEVRPAADPAPQTATPGETPGAASESDEDEQLCRVCRDDSAAEPLITPCDCQGSIRHVHASCLRQWRLQCARAREQCELCHSAYRGVEELPPLPAEASGAPQEPQGAPPRSAMVRRLETAEQWIGLWLCVVTSGVVGKATLGELSCMTPWGTVADTGIFSIEHHLTGAVCYLAFASLGYLSVYLQWLTWLAVNELDPHNLADDGFSMFVSPASVARSVLTALGFLALFIWAGYGLKFCFYLFHTYLVWEWDAAPTVGALFVGIVLTWAACMRALWRRVDFWLHFLLRRYGVEWEVVAAREERPAARAAPPRRRRAQEQQQEEGAAGAAAAADPDLERSHSPPAPSPGAAAALARERPALPPPTLPPPTLSQAPPPPPAGPPQAVS
eukprot:TRINITY_DN8331_c0_g1_i1.p1 TRINITY_DN8331_c0_g1~~TRINITY_DN8331_c0_g1_i1.p1  ORF type:complete len:778 (+),score=143.68 TRINITY_DN8331_c0_g1_i1:73-2334(+)